MEVAQLMSLGADILEREGYPDATESFELSRVDSVTRWAVAVALEDASGVVVPDSEICAANTLRDLVRLSCPGVEFSITPSASRNDGAAATRPMPATTAADPAGLSPEKPERPAEDAPLSAADLRAALGL
ncbi:phosphopantetheine-binding protein [Actinotignum sanguinis]|uniref:Phosphopantetheine-binding protein n=1 Tax=Actinotignum sanguinis TaxID=1445614 RepID=A0ABT5V5D2_9ACTO|nr:phosphopantetheine-binding protein [Actinotignum sanguinis]MDE1655984.1 phosphopantetheine-binding protein [Actinotignum sanguinis]